MVKRDYDVTQPIHTHVPVREFVREGWCKGDSKLYMHQWQFPLSDTAAAKLCHRSRPLPIMSTCRIRVESPEDIRNQLIQSPRRASAQRKVPWSRRSLLGRPPARPKTPD